MKVPALGFAAISLLISGTYIPLCVAGNGSERGGGEYDAQAFAADGEDAVRVLTRWNAPEFQQIDLKRLELAIKSTKDIHFTSSPQDYDQQLKDSHDVQRDIINIPAEMRIIVWAPAAALRAKDIPARDAIALHEFLNFYFRANLDGKGPLLASDQTADDRAYGLSETFLSRLRNEMDEQGFERDVRLQLKMVQDTWESEFNAVFSQLGAGISVIKDSDDYDDCSDNKAKFHQKACLNLMTMVIESLSSFKIASKPQVEDEDIATLAKLAHLMGEIEGAPEGPMAQLSSSMTKFKKVADKAGRSGPDPIQAADLVYADYVKTLVRPERRDYANQKLAALETAYHQISGQYLESVESMMNQQFNSCPQAVAGNGAHMICMVDKMGEIASSPDIGAIIQKAKQDMEAAYQSL
jgi:hypothetical protein